MRRRLNRHEVRRRRVCRAYEVLYKARNDFIHGNRIHQRAVYIGSNRVALHKLGAVLYRMALSRSLDVRVPEMPAESRARGMREISQFQAERLNFQEIHGEFEHALVACGEIRRPTA